MAQKELGPGSEGDAYRYTKKVLKSLPNASRVEHIYREIARNKGISSWTRACYEELRTQFFRDGQCKIKFAPGVARIAYGELEFGTGDEDFRQLADLRDFVRIISIAHFETFTRHLALDGQELSFKDLVERFGNTVSANWKELKAELRNIKYGPRRYQIIWLDSFATAHKYYEYTKPHNWCHLGSLSMFRSYSFNRKSTKDGTSRVSVVKLYLAVLPGFETMTEDNPLYGESMLGIDIGPDGRLIHVNNRWNHSHDNVDDRKGDNKYSEKELSELLGGPFYKICPPLTKREMHHISGELKRRRDEENRAAANWVRGFADRVANGVRTGKPAKETESFVDSRDNVEYRTRKIGGLQWMLDPLSHMIISPINTPENMVKHKMALAADWAEMDKFNKKVAKFSAMTRVNYDADKANPADNTADNTVEDATVEPGDIGVAQWTAADGRIEESSSRAPSYCPLVSMVSGGRQNLFFATDVTKLSRAYSGSSEHIDRYLSECLDYREKRLAALKKKPAEKLIGDEVKNPSVYKDDNYLNVMENDQWSAVELITPLGFEPSSRSVERGYRINNQRMIINDVNPGNQFVYYRKEDFESVMPEGWRLPTVDEFVAMAMSLGAKAVFRSSVEYDKDNTSDVFCRQKAEDVIERARRAPHIEFCTADHQLRRRMYESVIISEIKRISVDIDEIAVPPNTPEKLVVEVKQPDDPDIEPLQQDPTVDDEPQEAIENIPAAVGVRFPDLEFDMADVGFAIPKSSSAPTEPEDSDTAAKIREGALLFTKYPILLSLAEESEFADNKSLRQFDRMFYRFDSAKDAVQQLYRDGDEDDNQAYLDYNPFNRSHKVVPVRKRYAVARWDSKHKTFRITPCNNEHNSSRYCLLYAVK
jgi:hypothetical protein